VQILDYQHCSIVAFKIPKRGAINMGNIIFASDPMPRRLGASHQNIKLFFCLCDATNQTKTDPARLGQTFSVMRQKIKAAKYRSKL